MGRGLKMKCLTLTEFKKMGGIWQSEYVIQMEKILGLVLTSMDRYWDIPELDRLNYINHLEQEVYNKKRGKDEI